MAILPTMNAIEAGDDVDAEPLNSNFVSLWDCINGNISSNNLATNAVTTAKIAPLNVTGDKIALNTITASNISTSAGISNAMLAGGITIEKLAAALAMKLEPVGKFGYFFLPSAPTGWLVCDGSVYDETTYTALYAAIGYTYGGTAEAPLLPDMRGLFVRGTGTNGFISTAVGAALGIRQEDQNALHIHSMYSQTGAAGANLSADYHAQAGIATNVGGQNTGPSGESEARPNNMSLLPCIKY
jgi:microcystin-dependent protein